MNERDRLCRCRDSKNPVNYRKDNICYWCGGILFKPISCQICDRICIQISKKWEICRDCKKEENVEKHGWKYEPPKIHRGRLLYYSRICSLIDFNNTPISPYIHDMEVSELVEKFFSWNWWPRYMFFVSKRNPLVPDIKKKILEYILILPAQIWKDIRTEYWQTFFADKQITIDSRSS